MSYNTVAEADTYFDARYGYDKWAPLDDIQKQQALTSAQQQLDLKCMWYGDPTDPEQDYAFPRDGDTEVPQDIKDAECEIAYNIVSAGSSSAATTEADPLSELTAGSVTLKFDTADATTTSTSLFNDLTDKLLSPYGLCGGSGSTSLTPMMRQ